jgi:hypothetical protein
MSRPKFAVIYIIIGNVKDFFRVFSQQKIKPALIVVLILIVIAIIFSFLAFTPVLSPFIYPLF